jgi:hypothetical protein
MIKPWKRERKTSRVTRGTQQAFIECQLHAHSGHSVEHDMARMSLSNHSRCTAIRNQKPGSDALWVEWVMGPWFQEPCPHTWNCKCWKFPWRLSRSQPVHVIKSGLGGQHFPAHPFESWATWHFLDSLPAYPVSPFSNLTNAHSVPLVTRLIFLSLFQDFSIDSKSKDSYQFTVWTISPLKLI